MSGWGFKTTARSVRTAKRRPDTERGQIRRRVEDGARKRHRQNRDEEDPATADKEAQAKDKEAHTSTPTPGQGEPQDGSGGATGAEDEDTSSDSDAQAPPHGPGMSKEMKEAFQELGIDVGSALPVAEKAFKIKAKGCHPDKNKAPDAQKKFVKLKRCLDQIRQMWKQQTSGEADAEEGHRRPLEQGRPPASTFREQERRRSSCRCGLGRTRGRRNRRARKRRVN